jgi:hypothetical protein
MEYDNAKARILSRPKICPSQPLFAPNIRSFIASILASPSTMSTYGTLFRVTTYGESHCASVGAIIDGCPPVCYTSTVCLFVCFLTTVIYLQGLELKDTDIQAQLSRRRPGQSNLTTPVGIGFLSLRFFFLWLTVIPLRGMRRTLSTSNPASSMVSPSARPLVSS